MFLYCLLYPENISLSILSLYIDREESFMVVTSHGVTEDNQIKFGGGTC
jgi:hypothetical protein